MWSGGDFGAATAEPVVRVNGLTGEVQWDVTLDVLAGAAGWEGRIALDSSER